MTTPGLDRSQFFIHIVLLLTLCGVLYFPYLGATPLFDKGEPREALAVQDIVQRGDWLFPLKRATAIPSKPPLFHWSAALTYQVSGTLNEATIRFPSAFYAILGVLLIYALGRRLFGAEVGLLAAVILATTMIYQNQALNARVDMTLCLFVTASLVLFYALYRGFFAHPVWYFALYVLVGLGTLAKGPLGLLLPCLVIVVFLAVKKRWDLMVKLALHPGVILTLLLVVGWYVLAITRGGESFVDHQLLSENLERFFGGSGHSHPVYYYFLYLFSFSVPWCFFFPFMFWDWLNKGTRGNDDQLFLQVWFGVMFVFFSLSSGKRPVYLLPVYPALALLLALWLHRQVNASPVRRMFYRAVAIFSAISGVILLFVAFGDLWSRDPGWVFAPIENLLKPKDRANYLVIKNLIANFGWMLDIAFVLWAMLWFALAYFLWRQRLLAAARAMVLLSIVLGFVSRGLVEPELSKSKSYRDFMQEVNRRVKPDDRLIIYGTIYSDPVVFYRGRAIDTDDRPLAAAAEKIVPGDGYVIMSEDSWRQVRNKRPEFPPPLLLSQGKGPEGDMPLVLLQARL